MRRRWLFVALLLSLGLNAGLLGAWLYRQQHRPPARPFPWGEGKRPFVTMADRLELASPVRERFLEQQRIFFELAPVRLGEREEDPLLFEEPLSPPRC
ncbi:MAG TPA: hypothetical protein PK570_01405, partial [Thermoanaerobaculia bacterium]|nr:hypothetical protein [Thermoanaerobaculia bacterium]